MREILWGLVCGLVIGGAGWLSAQAHADPGFEPEVIAYTQNHAAAVCSTLAAEPTDDGVADAGTRIVTGSNLSVEQAGEVIGLSVRTLCPQWTGLLEQFVQTSLPASSSTGVIL